MIEIIIYTDGSAKGNPGSGGYAAVLMAGQHYKELSGGYRKTTNNRMELMAVIVALEAILKPDAKVTVYSDSKYVVDAIEKGWLINWQKKSFAKVKNPDLWRRFLQVYQKHKVKFNWVKGHNNDPLNERCDEIAAKAASGTDLLVDEIYEKNNP